MHILCNRHLGVHLSVINNDYIYTPPSAWAIGPTYVYIHVQIHRLGKIAVNHFNQPYRLTDGL